MNHVPKTFADIEVAARHFHIKRPLGDGEPPSTRKTVILLTVSYGFIDFFRNWLYYFRKLAIGNYQGTSRFFNRVKNRVGSGSNPTRFFWDNRVGLPDFNPFADIVLTPYYLNRFIAVLT